MLGLLLLLCFLGGETMLGYFCFFVCLFCLFVVIVVLFVVLLMSVLFLCFRSSFAYCKCIRIFCLLRQSTGSGCENEGVYLIHVHPSLSAHPPPPLSQSLHPPPPSRSPFSLCLSPPPPPPRLSGSQVELTAVSGRGRLPPNPSESFNINYRRVDFAFMRCHLERC